MSDKSLGASPNKRQRKDTVTAKKKNAFDIMLDSSKLCWPSGDAPSHMPILQMVAENGWFPWNTDESSCQNPDFSNLRLVSKSMKTHMDNPANGGPDFKAIISFLDCKNGWDNDEGHGFCDHCYSNEGAGCETCEATNGDHESCPCSENHRYGPVLLELDPRVNPYIEFQTLPLREQAKLLLQFLRQVSFNFHNMYYEEWDKMKIDSTVQLDDEPDLTMISPGLYGGDVFVDQLKEYNMPFYNYIHHLLFTGWAENDCYDSPGSGTPFRGRLIGDGEYDSYWHGGHREWFGEMWECFMCLHKSNEEKTVPSQDMGEGWRQRPRYTISQIQYLPKTIRRIQIIDKGAEDLLGKSIADSIDMYRLIRKTYTAHKDGKLKAIQWMPCLGVSEENFVPMETFEGYNPHHARLDFELVGGTAKVSKISYKSVSNIDRTSLTWGEDGDGEYILPEW